jgi:hypothetical protein
MRVERSASVRARFLRPCIRNYLETYNQESGIVLTGVHLKTHRRKKDGKEHRYYSIVESRRVRGQRVVQRSVVYLGEIRSPDFESRH